MVKTRCTKVLPQGKRAAKIFYLDFGILFIFMYHIFMIHKIHKFILIISLDILHLMVDRPRNIMGQKHYYITVIH